MNVNDSDIDAHDRRQHERYLVTEQVLITFRPNFDRTGKVTDISEGGIGFEYVVIEKLISVEHAEVDIFSWLSNFHIPRIPCKVVYDVRENSFNFASSAIIRRCGLKFGPLSKRQKESLSAFFETLRHSP